LINGYQSFGGTCCLHLQDRRVGLVMKKVVHHGREEWDQAMSEPMQINVLKRDVFSMRKKV
jgi:hypothetical protein